MMNASVHDTSWHSPYSIFWQGVVWLIVFALSLETIIGNAMVIIAYKIERSISKQVSNRYIVSLAISDLIIGIEGFPLFTVYVLNGERWPLGSIACETWLFLDYTLCLVSILTVLLITADRYMSVCHTAKYLKWQNPTKTQALIILSWLIPAFVFGVMIYGWEAMSGSSTSMRGTECSAPFLSNPYVNMGMYVSYYWTTLVAMLILYKGIHQAAKNLEKKAKAKERRHIALILSQRLGTQVGVSLMLRSQSQVAADHAAVQKRDSGYETKPSQLAERRNGFSEPENSLFQKCCEEYGKKGNCDGDNLCVITEERSQIDRRQSMEPLCPCPNPSLVNSRRTSEQDAEKHTTPRTNRLSLRSTASIDSGNMQLDRFRRQRSLDDSLKKLFTDDVDSILNFREPLTSKDSDAASSVSFRSSTEKYEKRKKRPSSRRAHGSAKRIAQMNMIKRAQEYQRQIETDRPGASIPSTNAVQRTWVKTMKIRIGRAFERRVSTPSRKELSSSTESISSSDETSHLASARSSTKVKVPQLVVTEQGDSELSERLQHPPKSDTFLSASSVSRKISSLSTTLTRERVISSIFAPIAVFNRGRKQTKAEKRAHKAFRTITFIVGCFAILWSPYYIMATVYGFCKGECIPSFLYTLSYYMCYLNSSGNPFAYALANRQFRTAFLRMLRGNFNNVA